MKTCFLASVFLCVVGVTTAGVIAAQEKPQPQADKPAAAKPHTMTGCLEKGTEADMFRLSNVEGTGPKTVELHAEAAQKLSAHVGHKIAVTGTTIDPATIKKGTTGKPAASPESKPTGKEHHMQVTSVKHISPTCPS